MRLFALSAVVVAGFAAAPAEAHMDAGVGFDVPQIVMDAAEPLAAPSSKRLRRSPRPDPRRTVGKKANPLYAGLAAGGAAGGTALVGGGIASVAVLALLGAFGAPSLPVTITAAVIGGALVLGTPILAGLAGGGARM